MSSAVTLRARRGRPLDDDRVRGMVEATARAVAERHGIDVLRIATTADSLTATLDTGRIQALGFAAELRRLTSSWYAHTHEGLGLWDEAPGDGHDHDDDDDDEDPEPEV